MTVDNLKIPLNATIRQEYVKCGDPDCQTSHGPYLYAYWKQDMLARTLKIGWACTKCPGQPIYGILERYAGIHLPMAAGTIRSVIGLS